MTFLQDLPTTFLWHAVNTNPTAKTFPWSISDFPNGAVPYSAIIEELRRRPEGVRLLQSLKPHPASARSEDTVARDLEFYKNYKSDKKRVVLVGNFDHPHSTESHHKWTWEKLGWEVSTLQENRTSTDAIVTACKTAQLLQYTHTHGWNTGGSYTMDEAIEKVREMGVPSFSYHLELYWGLGKLDSREDRIGHHPSWKVDYFFSTDGAHELEFQARGVTHVWMPPAVVEYGCYKGTYNQALKADIGFIGSVGYHPEYPFRTAMVKALQAKYGPRFRTYVGMREKALNNVYASVKIVVGDHCFAGMPRYWSDRLPESCGRGAFIIYPKTEGMTIPTATYEPQDMDSLISQIEYYLEHEQERAKIQEAAFNHVKQYDTYTNRLIDIQRIIFG
jgi:hypothetical protein